MTPSSAVDNFRAHADVLLGSPYFSCPTPNRSQHLSVQLQKQPKVNGASLRLGLPQQVLFGYSQYRLELASLSWRRALMDLIFKPEPSRECRRLYRLNQMDSRKATAKF